MSLNYYRQRVASLVDRIKQSFQLEEDQQELIPNRQVVLTWIAQEQSMKRDQIEKFNNETGLKGLLNLTGLNNSRLKEMDETQKHLHKLKQIFKGQTFQFKEEDLQNLEIPPEVMKSINYLKGRRFPKQYFGIVSCPLMKRCFIKSKESYDNCITREVINEMKCVNLGSQSAHVIHYQRYMIEHLFNHLFNKDNEFTVVMKINIDSKNNDKMIEIYCCVQDLSEKPQQYLSLEQLQEDSSTRGLYIEEGKEKIELNVNIFQALLTQLLLVPLQTIVSDYVITKDKKGIEVRKMHTDKNFDIFHYMKEHTSLRNPLTYFRDFIRYHELEIEKLKEILSFKNLNSSFYEIMNIMFEFMENDFDVTLRDTRSMSFCINEDIMALVWSMFQQMIILSNWLEEVINPIKKTVTMFQIQNKLFPIATEMLKETEHNYQDFKSYILNLPIENHLSITVSKWNIERYKDKYMSLDWVQPISYKEPFEIYANIFAKTFNNYDLRNTNVYEKIYFLNFLSNNYIAIYDENIGILVHQSWKDRQIWNEVIQLRNKEFQHLEYIGISLDLMALNYGIDSVAESTEPFESIKNDQNEDKLIIITKVLFKKLKEKYPKRADVYLSYLIEKAFKYKKYIVARYLIESGVHIKHFKDIFKHTKDSLTTSSKFNTQTEKNKLIQLMKTRQPQMFRKYLWEQLINVKLKEGYSDEQNLAVLLTIKRGKLYIDKQIYSSMTEKKIMNNTLSRKDYMFGHNRLIARVDFDDASAYIQLSQYPLLRYFYHFFLKLLDKSEMSLNFCGFFTEEGTLFHLIERIPHCFNFQKGLQHHTESQLKNYLDVDDISEAIILSIILMPNNVTLKNIIISPELGKECSQRKSLFIVDFTDFYQKNGFELNGGNVVLKVKNSLFLFDQMENSINKKLIQKYSELSVMDILNKVFKKSAQFIQQTNKIRPRSQSAQRQLISIIFQNDFAFALAQRMFKIKNVLTKRLEKNSPISHSELLEFVNPQLRYYYEQVRTTTHNLVEREKIMLDDSFKKYFLVSESMINFIGKTGSLKVESDTFPHHYMRFNFQGPSQNLRHLHEKAIRLAIFNEKITAFNDYDHSTIEYFIRHIDLSEYEKEERQLLFDKIQQYSLEYLNKEKNRLPLSVIRITNIEGLRGRNLKFSDERLDDLIFEDVSVVESQFSYLIKKYQSMKNLSLRGITGLERIGQGYINIAQTLELKNLKALTITNCPNLQKIDIKCNQLKYLTLRNNIALTHIYVNSQKLKNIDCSQCSKLHLENIGIYLFMKRNVLLCKNSCDGDVKRLQDKNYAIYLTRVLRYLCNRFEQNNYYKLDLILTLSKLELIDEKSYRFGSAKIGSNWTALLSFITKAGTQTLNATQEQIIKIFLNNEQVDLLSIDELLKIQKESLTNIVNCLSQKKLKKQFKEVKFCQIIKQPQLFEDHLHLINLMFKNLQVEKVFTVHLTLIPEIACEFYMELLRILNEKPNLQKLCINFENSTVDYEFFEALFNLKAEKKKIYKVCFNNCEVAINDNTHIEDQSIVREMSFVNCNLISLKFIGKFTNLTQLELNKCKIPSSITTFYKAISTLQQLKSLSLINLKNTIFEKNIELKLLFQQLKKLKKLESLDFSENHMTFEELEYFSKSIYDLKLYQLTLNDFYDGSISEPIKNFLSHEHLRIIIIEFKIKKNKQILESFISELASNKSIIKLRIKTDYEIPSPLFDKLNSNTKLQQIHSNQSIPNWLKNHIATNSQSNETTTFESEPYECLTNTTYRKEDFYRIGLSLDGGGVRGMLLATELNYICENVKQPLHKIFDVIGGTSIGGILALGSTGTLDGQHPVCTTRDCMQLFEKYGDKIFKKSQLKQLTNIFDTKYDVKSFDNLIEYYLKDSKLSDCLKETNVLVTAVNRLTNQDMIFRSISAIFDRNKDFYMRDIARATSAAPTYFPSAQIKNVNATEKFSLIDGGVGLNNPSKLVIDDVIKIAQNESGKVNYFLLSLGTGRLTTDAVPENAGIINLAPIIDSFTESATFFIEKDLAQNYKGHYLRVSPLIGLSRKDAELDNTKPQIMKAYKQVGEVAAEQAFSNKIAYGKFKNESFVEWLAENTARKYDI